MHNYDQVDADEVRAAASLGESLEREFKRADGALTDRDVLEAVVCMANGGGGLIYLGVEDDGEISGCRPWHGSVTDPFRLAAMIRHRTLPWLETVVAVVPVGSVEVVVIEVPPAATPTGTADGTYKRRTLTTTGEPACLPYTPHDLISAGLSLRGLDYATIELAGATMDDLDPAEFDRFRRWCQSGRGDVVLAGLPDDEILRALMLRPVDRPGAITTGAVLLFGTHEAVERHIPTAEVLFQDTRPASQLNASLRGPLLWQLAEVERLLNERNAHEEVFVGLHRVDVPTVPTDVFREAVANALVHRDYALLGPTRIHISPERLRVSSPGGFPPGITLSNVFEESRPRSVALADALKRAGLVERRGGGVGAMYASLLRLGREEPDYTASTSDSVNVDISTSRSDMDMLRFILAFEDAEQDELSLNAVRLLREVKAAGPATSSELAETLALTRSSVQAVTTRLVEQGLMESRGRGRAAVYHLSPTFYRLAEDKSAYLRVRPYDERQQEQLVIDFVREHGSIKRGQAAELLRLQPREARLLLKRLVDRGMFELRGERRGSYYVISPSND